MIEFRDLYKYFGTQPIFEQASFRILAGERVGIVGPNGAGKSTVFSLITGQTDYDKGELILPRNLRAGHLRQQLEPDSDTESLLDYVLAGAKEVAAIEQEIHRIETRLTQEPDDQEQLLSSLGRLEEQFQHLGGYDRKHRAESSLSGLGFSEANFSRPFTSFSGGWQMRAELARTLIAHPDLLLLDEPSNFLDLPAVEWLQRFLKDYPGTLLLISHDRFLLRSLTTVTLEIAAGKATRYEGDHAYYLRERENRYQQQLAAWKNQQQKRQEMERFIERFRAKATKASQVQSRVKMLEKMDVIDEPMALKNRSLIRIAPPPHSGHEILRLEQVCFAYEAGHNILQDIDLRFVKGDRVALIGYNGMGKTTLLRIISGTLEPDRGKRVLGHHVVAGYQSQEFAETMPPEQSVLEIAKHRAPDASQGEVRNLLGGFGFNGDDVYKSCKVLSGGEKIRLAFARLFIHPPNLLILDEPTTHLDIDGRCALEDALQEYTGTVVLVSHDIDFVRKTATQIVAMKPGGKIDTFDGTYDEYRARRGDPSPAPLQKKKKNAKAAPTLNYKQQQAEVRRRQRAIEKLEKVLQDLEVELNAQLDLLSAGGDIDYPAVNAELQRIQNEFSATQQAWELAFQQLEAIES